MQEIANYSQVSYLNLELLNAQFRYQCFSRHTHEGYGVCLTRAGAHRFYARGQTHVATAGDIIVLNADTMHDGQSATGQSYWYQAMFPLEGAFVRLQEEMQPKTGFAPHFSETVVRNPALARQLSDFFHLARQSDNRLALERQYLLVLTGLLKQHATNPPQEAQIRKIPRAVERICDYLNTYYSENISLQTLADLVELNPYYLLRLFRNTTGLPPHAYQIQKRLQHAKSMIFQGMKLSEVAQRTGFTDQSHLNRHFKRRFGVSPGRFTGH